LLHIPPPPPPLFLAGPSICSHAASSYRCLPIVQWLLSQGASPNIRDADGDTPLMACEDPACADALVASGADIDAVNNEGSSAFFIATWEQRVEMIEWLRARYIARGMQIPEVPAAEDFGDMEAIDEADELINEGQREVLVREEE
jgi:hypothetical protein